MSSSFIDTLILPSVSFALRLVTGIDVPLFEKKFARSFTERYGKTVHRYVAGGFMKYENDHVFLTDEGFDVSNTIMSEFL